MNSPEIRAKAETWLSPSFDEDTRKAVQHLLDHDADGLNEAFYKDLDFGTGGLRGIMGVGTNRVNRYTIGMATQGLSNYIKQSFPEGGVKVAIGYDSRNQSREFAEMTAQVFAANGFQVYLFDSLRPTPQLSFAIRHYGCKAGVVVTASHNPKEYNGYKVYWEDGGQLVPPHDKAVISEVRKLEQWSDVKLEYAPSSISVMAVEMDEAYLSTICGMSLSPEAIEAGGDLGIVYTNLHGTGGQLIPQALERLGFTAVSTVAAQDEPDGNFPTVHSPNPEEPAALAMALEQADKEGADLVMGTDPDTDRIGIAVRNHEGDLVLLNGNQTASMLVAYLLTRRAELKLPTPNTFIAKTIVTSDLLRDIAEAHQVECLETLTGFKYIAELIHRHEGVKSFIGGGEESYGYLIGDAVRDKDAVVSALFIAEMAAWLKQRGQSVYQYLAEVNAHYGFYRERLVSVKREGREGLEAIRKTMSDLRSNPPKDLNGETVAALADYQSGVITNLIDGSTTKTGLPASNVLQFRLADGSKVTARPSGTEPKIKFYVSVTGSQNSSDPQAYDTAVAAAEVRIDSLMAGLPI